MSEAITNVGKGVTDIATPVPVYDAINGHFNFTLDAAADETNRKCERWLEGPCVNTEDCGCGLCADWLEHTVFLNPPYVKMQPWVEKCSKAASLGATVGLLCNAAMGAEWWRWAEGNEQLHKIWYLNGRIKFDGYPNVNPLSSAVLVWKPEPTKHLVTAHYDWREDKFTNIIEGVRIALP